MPHVGNKEQGYTLAANKTIRYHKENSLEPELVDALLKNLDQATFLIDQAGMIIKANQAFYDLLQSNSNEIINIKFDKILAKDLDNNQANKVNELIDNPQSQIRVKFLLPNHPPTPVELRTQKTIFNNQNAVLCFVRGICRDITEKQYLLEAKRRFEFITNVSNDPILLINRDLQIEAANKSARTFLLSEHKNQTTLYLGDIWDKNIFGKHFERPLKQCFQGTRLSFPLKCIPKSENQKKRLLQISLFPFRQETGVLSHAVLMFRDITKQERIQLALKESEARFRKLFNNSVLGIYQSTVDGSFLNINPAFARMLGYSDITSFMAENRHNASAIYVDPLHRNLVLEKSLNSTKPQKHELFLKRKDGSEFVALDYTWTVRDANGNVLYIEGFLEDINEQKKAEQKLAESRNLLLSTFTALKDLVVVISPKKEIIMTNWTDSQNHRGNKRSKKCHELLLGKKTPCRLCRADSVFEKGMPKSFESIDPRDDSIKEVHLYPIKNQSGEVTLVVEHLRDITQTRKAEKKRRELKRQLREARKMESLGKMAGEIAHDFNNILGVIVGFAQLAKEAGQNGKNTVPDLDQILLATDRARKTVRQILTFSRKVELEFKPLNLNQTIKTCQGLLQGTMPGNISLKARTTPDLKLINGDQVSLEQIILNLAVNAKDAMPQGGTFDIATKNLRLSQSECRHLAGVEPGPYVMLEISDTGRGMDQETIKHIFEPFFTTKKKDKGTGLGLSSVYGIVKSHQGAIECTSRPGRGTRFKIYIPALKKAELGKEAISHAQELPKGNETILVVDHEEQMLVITKRILERQGYEVITKKSGEEGLETYFKLPRLIDMVILNVGIPSQGGYAFLQELRSFDPLAKVLITSGTLPEKKLRSTMDQGALGFLGKPFDQLSLLKSVRQLLDETSDPGAFSKASV